jgi:hypothetical protein
MKPFWSANSIKDKQQSKLDLLIISWGFLMAKILKNELQPEYQKINILLLSISVASKKLYVSQNFT